MLVSCPHCTAGYDVPDDLLAGAGGRLRCLRCEQDWIQAIPGAVPKPVATPAPAFDTPRAIPLSTPSPSTSAPLPAVAVAVSAWVLTLMVMTSLGWGALHWRGDVMTAWPPSERAYAALGLR